MPWVTFRAWLRLLDERQTARRNRPDNDGRTPWQFDLPATDAPGALVEEAHGAQVKVGLPPPSFN